MSQPRKRVLFMIPTLAGGGSERVLVTILQHLDRAVFDPTLAVVDTRNAVFLNDVPKDVPVIDLRSTRVRYALPKLWRLIWSRRPDVVLSTLGQLNLALAVLRPLLPGRTRYVARESTIPSADVEMRSSPWLWRWAYRRFYRRFDALICQSRGMQEDLIKHFNVVPAKTVVIHNPVDLQRIRQLAGEHEHHQDPARAVRLVSAGRFSREKGFDLLIDAVALCKRLRIELTLLGDGPLRRELEQLAVTRGIGHQVKFAGFQRNPYLFFARADAFVLSSRIEGFPNVVLEALACGTPVISTPAAGGVREILEEIRGCTLAKELTAQSLAEAIESFPFQQQFNSRAAIKRYAAPAITKKYEEELLKDNRK